jgi:hypothetical protein
MLQETTENTKSSLIHRTFNAHVYFDLLNLVASIENYIICVTCRNNNEEIVGFVVDESFFKTMRCNPHIGTLSDLN